MQNKFLSQSIYYIHHHTAQCIRHLSPFITSFFYVYICLYTVHDGSVVVFFFFCHYSLYEISSRDRFTRLNDTD